MSNLAWKFRRLGHKGSVAVEFALVSSLFLLPLFIGASAFVIIIGAKAQLNTTLQSLYYFAWTNPSSANDQTQLSELVGAINSGSIFSINFPATMANGTTNGSFSYVCVTPGATPSFTAATGPGLCSKTQVQQTFVTYEVNTTVSLPVKIPSLSNPLTLTVKGQIETQ